MTVATRRLSLTGLSLLLCACSLPDAAGRQGPITQPQESVRARSSSKNGLRARLGSMMGVLETTELQDVSHATRVLLGADTPDVEHLELTLAIVECLTRFAACNQDLGAVVTPERILSRCWVAISLGSLPELEAIVPDAQAWCSSVSSGPSSLRQLAQLLQHYISWAISPGGSPFTDRAREYIEVALGDLTAGEVRVSSISFDDGLRLSLARVGALCQARLIVCRLP